MDDPRSRRELLRAWSAGSTTTSRSRARRSASSSRSSTSATSWCRGEFHLGDAARRSRPDHLPAAAPDGQQRSPGRARRRRRGSCPTSRSRDVKSMPIDAGHVGLVVSGKAQKTSGPRRPAGSAERSAHLCGASEGNVGLRDGKRHVRRGRASPAREAAATPPSPAGVLEGTARRAARTTSTWSRLSGTSGGALCAALAWDGLVRGDPQRAIEKLQAFWEAMARDASPWDQLVEPVAR